MSTNETGERNQSLYKTAKVDDLDIFYREAGPADAPTILLLHGFPTSSHMFRNLIMRLSDKFHLIAPAPAVDAFDYSFDHMAQIMEKFIQGIQLKRCSMYLEDYGAPIGFRIAAKHPDWIEALIIQNGNAYEEGLKDFWIPIEAFEQIRCFMHNGMNISESINPHPYSMRKE